MDKSKIKMVKSETCTTWKQGNRIVAKLYAPNYFRSTFRLELTYLGQARDYSTFDESVESLNRFLDTTIENRKVIFATI